VYEMKKGWKWVIGIVIVLVVVTALVVGAFLLRSHFANVVNIAKLNRPGVKVPGYVPRQRFPGVDGWGVYGMHMRGPGILGFGRWNPLGGIIVGVFCLGFLALVVLGIIWLVRRLRNPAAVSAAVSPAAPVTPIAEPVTPVVPVAAVHPCPKCGEPVQEGWKHCPNCGKKQ
jgi:hypothetical protein